MRDSDLLTPGTKVGWGRQTDFNSVKKQRFSGMAWVTCPG